ncbi:hypothetical protein L226DRAFT_571382 [Lentinus tigrinus ALCF2SS1-7]|uniref:Zn(2)-C6 fungal-type domain-containing protein n=1 Tax=Lentinus tigrinus ALCF2SS1-6 TaxID=1328759 RepID=A0A5C2SE33_9APHY|nr:hypothetical protein L227DRAFT_609867 [Lentinus tigrinus ALCF2SS1-6]RPD74495.1 hypothetical protein L226DRAFT_571382 [Lentinus tigrinus ALCF2SS1-7]
MSNNSGNNSSSGRAPLPFDPSLLQPIVRSKRTPIACTECRRRQVKCSGTTPRCERCQKKNIECAYMSLSEQRTGTGGSISRSGTPVIPMHGGSGHSHHSHGSSRLAQSSGGWQSGGQAYPAGTGYPVPQGWQEPQYSGSQSGQSNQSYAGVPMAYQQGFDQQAAFAQGGSQGGADMYAQSYAQQGYAGGTTYNAYGQNVPATDPRYAYQTAQMMGGNQQSVAYTGQYAQQQVYFDPTTGQMIPADMAAQWTDNNATGFQAQHYPGQS